MHRFPINPRIMKPVRFGAERIYLDIYIDNNSFSMWTASDSDSASACCVIPGNCPADSSCRPYRNFRITINRLSADSSWYKFFQSSYANL